MRMGNTRIELDGDNGCGATAVESDSAYYALMVAQALTLSLKEDEVEKLGLSLDG